MSRVNTLVLDAGPLINQPAATLQGYAQNFVTTPGVFAELRDENARKQVVLWGDRLKIRQPKSQFVKRVVDFARLTGDSTVLSTNDIHIIALAYEMECELNKGDWRLKKYPGEKKERVQEKIQEKAQENEPEVTEDLKEVKPIEPNATKTETGTETGTETETKKKSRRRGGRKHKKKTATESESHGADAETTVTPEKTENTGATEPEVEELTESMEDLGWQVVGKKETALEEEYDEEEDEGEWITSENIDEEIIKDKGEKIEQQDIVRVKVALATGDFACQNVSLQIGINLMNTMTGMRIKRVRNYMLRCHACFRLHPIPKDGKPKHFCSSCGGATLIRCAVSVDSKTGQVTPHLKKNFQWFTRGNRYSLPSPQSKANTRRVGNGGYQHKKENNHQEILLLREDQKEYQLAIKNEMWQKRQMEKQAEEWLGTGGSADGYISPFHSDQIRSNGVRVNKGRFANSVRRTRK